MPLPILTAASTNIRLFSNAAGVKTSVSLASAVFTYDATTTTLTISSLPVLVNNTQYELNIYGQGNPVGAVGVKSSNGVLLPMPQWMIPFGRRCSRYHRSLGDSRFAGIGRRDWSATQQRRFYLVVQRPY